MTNSGLQRILRIPAASAALVLSVIGCAFPAAGQTGQRGQVHIQKICNGFTGSPGSYCTISESDLSALPASTKVYYNQPAPIPEGTAHFLDSAVVLYTGPGNWAVGRCTVDFATLHGLCTVSDGIGTLAGFSARLDVWIDSSTGITHWDGTYTFSPLPAR